MAVASFGTTRVVQLIANHPRRIYWSFLLNYALMTSVTPKQPNNMTPNERGIYTGTTPSEGDRSRADFLCVLFRSLDELGIRYCVLHSWEELPENLTSDLDLAVHPDDLQKLPRVFLALRSNGYRPLQGLNYALKGYRFDFLWFEALAMNSVGIDITYGYVEGGLILMSGEELVAKRQRRRNFWIADAAMEFAYLLARRTLKGSLPARQAQRLKCLVEEIDRPLAERIAGELFGGMYKVKATEACINGRLVGLLPKLKTQLWRETLKRDPLNSVRYALANVLRLIRRWLEPSGIFVVFLGPDGVGKSTLIKYLTQIISPAFRRLRVFHWRPMLLWRRKHCGNAADPHGRSQHGTWWSLGRLFAHLLDYWLGYWLVMRPLLARSGLVIFDRYFYDLLIDPKRYRYGGPLWVVRLLRALIPRPDLMFVLDAPEQILLSRKQEVAPEEAQRQRQTYLKEANGFVRTRVIDTSAPIPEVGAGLAQEMAEYLDQRFQRRYAHWLELGSQSELAQSLGGIPGV
jgi:thymidylate kinase